jgi:hypothetical protein
MSFERSITAGKPRRRRAQRIYVTLTEFERECIEAAAERESIGVTEWARITLVAAARRQINKRANRVPTLAQTLGRAPGPYTIIETITASTLTASEEKL